LLGFYAALGMFAGSLVLGIILMYCMRYILESPALKKTNYRGAEVPTGAGIIFAPTFLVAWIGVAVVLSARTWYTYATTPQRAASARMLGYGMNMMLILVLGMCLVGLLDDVAGDSSARGFRGHVAQALHGRLTTGLFKALLGFAVALAVTAQLYLTNLPTWSAYGKWVLDAALIALAANLLNLLDLRPGRSIKAFIPLFLIAVALTARLGSVAIDRVPWKPIYAYIVPALSVAAVSLVLFPGDLREKFMMGDAGSNVLGAVVGLGLVLGLGFWWRLGVLVFLVLLTLISEKFSFSRAIEGNRVLNWLDELGRQRREPPGSKI
jgi:UDP-GlcNAc:undecaprenyl-phosphate GlcNAc-1-phosphate transferase